MTQTSPSVFNGPLMIIYKCQRNPITDGNKLEQYQTASYMKLCSVMWHFCISVHTLT